MLAHVVGPNRLPLAVQWLAALMFWGGLLGAVLLAGTRRQVAFAVGVVGAVVVGIGWMAAPGPPPSPGFTLMVASPGGG